MSFDEKYLNSYISIIQEMETEEQIEGALPSRETQNYEDFIQILIQKFMEIRQTLSMMLLDVTDDTDQKYLEEELERNDLHLSILNHCLEKTTIHTENPPKRNVIFLKTASDGVSFFEKDLKTFPKEYLPYIMELYEKLKQDFYSKNDVLLKKMKENPHIKDFYELKDFKIRLVFRILKDNTAVVIAAYLKKSNSLPKNIRELLKDRNVCFEKNSALFEEFLSDAQTRQSLLQETLEIENNIQTNILGERKIVHGRRSS